MDHISKIFEGVVPIKIRKSAEEHNAHRREQGRNYRAREKHRKLLAAGKPGLDNVPEVPVPNGLKLKDMTPEQLREYHRRKYREHIARQKSAQQALDQIMTNITVKMAYNRARTLDTSNSVDSEVSQV